MFGLRHPRPAFRVAPETVGTEGYGLDGQLKPPVTSMLVILLLYHLQKLSCWFMSLREQPSMEATLQISLRPEASGRLQPWCMNKAWRQCMKPADSTRVRSRLICEDLVPEQCRLHRQCESVSQPAPSTCVDILPPFSYR